MKKRKLTALNKFKRTFTNLRKKIIYYISYKKASRKYHNKNYESAYEIWKKLYGNINFSETNYIFFLRLLLKMKDYKMGFLITDNPNTKYKSEEFNFLALTFSLEQKKPENIIKYFERYQAVVNKVEFKSVQDWISVSNAYMQSNQKSLAKKALEMAIQSFPQDQKMISDEYLALEIQTNQLQVAIDFLEKQEQNFERDFKIIMLYQALGNQKEYKHRQMLFQECYADEINNDKAGYRTMILFDNGESRIEFVKKLNPTNRIIITFDSINMTWDKPSFAFRLLNKEHLDIVAVRKRTEKTYQQDLLREDFIETVEPLMFNYADKMSYGFSLGAYQTLYYASLLNCRILAMSPRLSIHPIYGRKKIITKFDMLQEKQLPANPLLKPIIVYDPKNALDHKYIKHGILPKFPNAKLIKLPYAGHSTAPYLRDTKQLKKFVNEFLNKRTPKFDRTQKSNSMQYHLNLAKECYKHNKFYWALNIIDVSLKDNVKNVSAIKLKVQSLAALKRYDDALGFALEANSLIKNNLDLHLLILDLYIEMNEMVKAQKMLSDCKEIYGNKNILKKREMLISS